MVETIVKSALYGLKGDEVSIDFHFASPQRLVGPDYRSRAGTRVILAPSAFSRSSMRS
jgi:hypothetical protein